VFKRGLLAVLAAGLLFTQQAGAAYYAFAGNAFTFSAGSIAVPDVVGLSEAAADAALEAELLDSGTITQTCSSEPIGEVVGQSPAAGVLVNAGALIDLDVSDGTACWDLTGIPAGWYSIANALADQEFVAIMRQEANDAAVWAYWLAGAPRGSANLRLDLNVIRTEADGSAAWARWAPGTQPGNTGNLQIDMRAALTANFQ
jgi:hypothetical protein